MKVSITLIPNFVLLLAIAVAMGMIKLSPSSVKQELANLCKDPASRCIAMTSLTKHIEQLEEKLVPRFLGQVFEFARKSKGSHIHAIILCELAARKHGTHLVSHVSIIMSMLTVALKSSSVNSNLALRQACAKLVRSISNYIIYPISLASLKEQIFRDLCNRVAEAPGCMHALVESQSWKLAPKEVINEVCLQATRALMEAKGSSMVIGHMQLICSLVKANCLNLQPYGRVLLKAVVEIFESATNWQQRLNAVQVINSFLKSMEAMILRVELPRILRVLESHRNDKIYSLTKAVAEAIRRAKLILSSAKSVKYSINYPALTSEKSMVVDDFLFVLSTKRSGHMQSLKNENVYPSLDRSANSIKREELIRHREGFGTQNSSVAGWRVRHNPIADDKFLSGESNGRMVVGLKGGVLIEEVELVCGCADHGIFDNRINTQQQEICSAASSNTEGSENASSNSSSNMFKLPNTKEQMKWPSNRLVEKTEDLQAKIIGEYEGLEQEAGSTSALDLQQDKSSVCSSRMERSRINLTMLSRSWKKARGSIGFVLRATLCAALLIPAVIASSKFLKMQEGCHIFAPKMEVHPEKCTYTKPYCKTTHPAT